jgi:hypothetical protein
VTSAPERSGLLALKTPLPSGCILKGNRSKQPCKTEPRAVASGSAVE